MEPGYTLFRIVNENLGRSYWTLVDHAGDVVWYKLSPAGSSLDVRQLENGDLFAPMTTNFSEINLLGETVHSWATPHGLTIDFHDGVPTDHGTILYLTDASRVVTNFPTSSTLSNAPLQTAGVEYQRVIELSATNSALLNNWSLIDMLDPTRIDYLTFTARTGLGWDGEHANAVLEDPRDNSIIVSMRHQDAVIKFSRTNSQLKWILGPHANWKPPWQPFLLTPTGDPFLWNYAQHAPTITPQGTLLLYDDGNYRASPFDARLPDAHNFSRAVEYDLNEDTMEVSQVWDYGRDNPEPLYTDRVGNAEWLPLRRNVLVTFGYVLYDNGVPPNSSAPNAVMTRIKEVTHEANPEVVFDLEYFDYGNSSFSYRGTGTYRSHRVPDLYPVVTAARSVTDLVTAVDDSGSLLQGSLAASLGAALQSIGKHHLAAAVSHLRLFQFLLPLSELQSGIAHQFSNQAQSVIDALNAGKTTYATERLTGLYPTYSPNHAMADLIEAVGDANLRNGPTLITCLSAALASNNRNDSAAALRELLMFQSLVTSANPGPSLTRQFKDQVRRIIAAVSQRPDLKDRHLRLNPQTGRLHLQFEGNPATMYTVQASADMIHWTDLGVADSGSNGEVEYNEAHLDTSTNCFIQVVCP